MAKNKTKKKTSKKASKVLTDKDFITEYEKLLYKYIETNNIDLDNDMSETFTLKDTEYVVIPEKFIDLLMDSIKTALENTISNFKIERK